jgi:hypothetical protein
MHRKVLFFTWVIVAGTAASAGWDYYPKPLEERAFTPAHEYFAPHAPVGHGYGVVGSLFMVVGVVGYGVRKRWRPLRRAGNLKTWLDVHIFLCTLGPFLVLLHTTFKFGGIVSISFWSMVIVVLSGVFGRYVYVRIPKTVHGAFLSLEAVAERRDELLNALRGRIGEDLAGSLASRQTHASDDSPGLLRGLFLAVRYDSTRRRRERQISSALKRSGVPRSQRLPLLASLRDEARLREQMVLLKPFQRLFHYWHVLHLPLAIVMFLILAVHVAVALVFGYGWALA